MTTPAIPPSAAAPERRREGPLSCRRSSCRRGFLLLVALLPLLAPRNAVLLPTCHAADDADADAPGAAAGNGAAERHVLIGFKDRDRMLRFVDRRRRRFLRQRQQQQSNEGGGDDEDPRWPLLLRDQPHTSTPTSSSTAAPSITSNPALDRVNAVKLVLEGGDGELERLLAEEGDGIRYWEEDHLVSPLAVRGTGRGEITPYGVGLVGADRDTIAELRLKEAIGGRSGDCDDPSSFKVAVIDSGVDANHPDIPCLDGQLSSNCEGIEFGLRRDEVWYDPTDIHGTHVMGTISALRSNGLGIAGIVPDGQGVCFLIARVFGQSVENARLSDILQAVQWAASRGANVINLSLGGAMFSTTARDLYSQIRSSGRTLVVSASGNDGSSRRSYPASYSSVISVAAVDAKGKHADFSQHNSDVDLSAPGLGILSTVPRGLGSITTVSVASDGGGENDSGIMAVSGSIMAESVLPPRPDGITGPLVYCRDLGENPCSPPFGGSADHVCIIERGTYTFEEKARNCERGGGKAALIYNNVPGVVAGTLSAGNSVSIPVAGLTQEDGLQLLNHLSKDVTLSSQDGYAFSDGTSFAAPHVAGVAAAAWSACGPSSCTADNVQYCLESTAKDLGFSGQDEFYGHGLVQLKGTYNCLLEDVKCCSDSDPPVDGGEPDPTPPDPAQDCSSSESAYQLCFITELSTAEAARCRACVNREIPYNVYGSSCDYLQSELCPAIHDDCTDCAPCRDRIDFYLGCSIRDINGCDLDCDDTTSNSGQSANVNDNGSVFNNPRASTPSSDNGEDSGGGVDIFDCENALHDMRECLVLDEAGISPNLVNSNKTTGAEGSCETCIESALSFGLNENSCDSIDKELCFATQQCGCDFCKAEMERYVWCRVNAETEGSCQITCKDPAFGISGSSSSGGSSGTSIGTMLATGMLCCAAWLLL